MWWRSSISRSLILLSLVCASWIASCSSRRDTPDKGLSRYLELSFNLEDAAGKRQLLLATTGDLHDAISRATDASIHEAFVAHRYQMLGYSILERRELSANAFEIRFALRYLERSEGAKSFEGAPKILVENTVLLRKEGGVWKVSKVVGSDATFDFPLLPSATIGSTR